MLVSIVDVGALAAFTILHAAVIGYFVIRRRAAASAGHVIVPLLGACATLRVLWGASAMAVGVAAAWLCAGLVVNVAAHRPPDVRP